MSKDFIQEVLNCTKAYEPPERFYYWASIAAISAVLKDRVWFDMGGLYNLYPNLYILLYGPSAVKKGPPIALAESIVKKVKITRVINGRWSIEAIIKEMGTFQTREDKVIIKDSCAFVSASELSSSIISNPAAMDIMTHLYDRIYNEGEWNYKLKVGESNKLNKPTITWLSGTNEALFREFVPEKNINGGLIGRMFIISETKENTINSLMFKNAEYPDHDILADILRPCAQLSGEFQMGMDVRLAVNEWYNKFKKEIFPELRDETGFAGRILDYIMKVSMIIAAGRRQELVIIDDDVKEAMDGVLPLLLPAQKVAQTTKKTDASGIEKRGLVLTYLSNCENFKCTREIILKNLGLKLDHEDLDKVISYMLQLNVVNVNSPAGIVTYSLNMHKPEVASFIAKFRN